MESSGQDSKGNRGSRAISEPNPAAPEAARKAVGRLADRLRSGGALEPLTIIALVGAVLMISAEFLDLYKVETPGGTPLPAAAESAGGNHGYALLIIALVGIAGIAFARFTSQWQPAVAVAVLGLLALAIVLLGDLPDTSGSGLTEQRRVGVAKPAVGFWVELAGSVLFLAGGAGVAKTMRDRTS